MSFLIRSDNLGEVANALLENHKKSLYWSINLDAEYNIGEIIQHAFRRLAWGVSFDKNGNINSIRLLVSSKTDRYDDEMFNSIAKFVETGSSIETQHKTYRFENGKLLVLYVGKEIVR